MSIQDLREKRQAKTAECRVILDANPEKLPEEEKAKVDALMVEIDQINDKIEAEEKVLALTADDINQNEPGSFQKVEVQAKPVYDSIGAQLLDIRAMQLGTKDSPQAAERFQKVVNESGLSTGKDSEGGYLIETDKSEKIIQTSVETGVLSSRCTSQPIGDNADSFEYFAANDRDRSSGVFLGGVKAYRKAEAETMSKWVTAQIDPKEIKLYDQYALLKVTDRMLQDSVALTGLVKNAVPKAFAFLDDKEIFEGTGAGQHLGIMNSGVLVSVAKETSQTAKTIVAKNIVKMFARFHGNIGNACWFVNQDCTTELPFLTIGDKPIFVPGGTFANAPYGVLYGLPIVPIEHCETLGTKGDIVLGDFSQYLRITKGGTQEAESIHVRFLTNEKVFRWTKRNNGQPMHNDPITPLKGSNKLSPFICLDTRS